MGFKFNIQALAGTYRQIFCTFTDVDEVAFGVIPESTFTMLIFTWITVDRFQTQQYVTSLKLPQQAGHPFTHKVQQSEKSIIQS